MYIELNLSSIKIAFVLYPPFRVIDILVGCHSLFFFFSHDIYNVAVDPGFFLGGPRCTTKPRLMIYFNINKPLSFFFFCRTPVILESRMSWCTHSLHPPPKCSPCSDSYWSKHTWNTPSPPESQGIRRD